MTEDTTEDIVARADAFAEKAHAAVGQKRKYTGEDYIHHPREVAAIVATVPHTPEMLAAALLHDTVEDAGISINTIRALFGPVVAQLVEELTDVSKPTDGNRSIRKGIDLAHSARASINGKTIKLADLISNTKSIVAHDKGFARVYLEEKGRLLEVLKDGNKTLWNKAYAIWKAGVEELAKEE